MHGKVNKTLMEDLRSIGIMISEEDSGVISELRRNGYSIEAAGFFKAELDDYRNVPRRAKDPLDYAERKNFEDIGDVYLTGNKNKVFFDNLDETIDFLKNFRTIDISSDSDDSELGNFFPNNWEVYFDLSGKHTIWDKCIMDKLGFELSKYFEHYHDTRYMELSMDITITFEITKNGSGKAGEFTRQEADKFKSEMGRRVKKWTRGSV